VALPFVLAVEGGCAASIVEDTFQWPGVDSLDMVLEVAVGSKHFGAGAAM